MSINIKRFTNYDRAETDSRGRTIHIYRQYTSYLSKEDVKQARVNKEQLNIHVS